MTFAALALGLALGTPSSGLELAPTDDIWVYPHASDPQRDPFLRVWGSGGNSVWAKGEAPDSYSISLLRFDLAGIEKGRQLKSATLFLTHAAGAGFEPKVAKDCPIEVRLVTADFSEKKWSFGDAEAIRPSASKDALLGQGFPAAFPSDAAFAVEIDLMKGPAKLQTVLDQEAGKSLRLALCSTIDPASLGRSAVFKFHSKDTESAKHRPMLKLEWN